MRRTPLTTTPRRQPLGENAAYSAFGVQTDDSYTGRGDDGGAERNCNGPAVGQVPIERCAFQREASERVENDRHSSAQTSKYN